MRIIFLTLIASFFLFSCSHNGHFVSIPLSSFDISDEEFDINNKFRIITFSGIPPHKKNIDYFIHLIVVSNESKDTFNLLAIPTNEIISYFEKDINCFTRTSKVYKGITEVLTETEFIINEEKIDKVLVDENFVADTKNHYPTVIGFLSDFSKKHKVPDLVPLN